MEPTTVMMIVLGVMIVGMFLVGIFIGYAQGMGKNKTYQKLLKEKEELEKEHKLYEEYHTNQEIKQRRVINNVYQENAIRDLKFAIDLIEKSKVEEEAVQKKYLKYNELPFEPETSKYLNVLLGENRYVLELYNPSKSSFRQTVFLMKPEDVPRSKLGLGVEHVLAHFDEHNATVFDNMKFEEIKDERN